MLMYVDGVPQETQRDMPLHVGCPTRNTINFLLDETCTAGHLLKLSSAIRGRWSDAMRESRLDGAWTSVMANVSLTKM